MFFVCYFDHFDTLFLVFLVFLDLKNRLIEAMREFEFMLKKECKESK